MSALGSEIDGLARHRAAPGPGAGDAGAGVVERHPTRPHAL